MILGGYKDMKVKGGYCYGCEQHYSVDELGVDEYYKTVCIRRGTQETVGYGLYCKECDRSEDLIILIEQ